MLFSKNRPRHLSRSVLALLALSVSCHTAQGADPLPSDEIIDEVTVYGQRSLFRLRELASDAEDTMYALFNELNTDDRYDVECKWEIRYFSHMREKNCLPNYVRQALLEDGRGTTQMLQEGMGSVAQPQDPRIVAAREAPEMQEKLREAAEKSPEFYRAMSRHYELSEELRLRRRSNFRDD
jgi:hypothetical protein